MEAHGLAKADRFGLSDPYVVIRANGQKEVKCLWIQRFDVPRAHTIRTIFSFFATTKLKRTQTIPVEKCTSQSTVQPINKPINLEIQATNAPMKRPAQPINRMVDQPTKSNFPTPSVN